MSFSRSSGKSIVSGVSLSQGRNSRHSSRGPTSRRLSVEPLEQRRLLSVNQGDLLSLEDPTQLALDTASAYSPWNADDAAFDTDESPDIAVRANQASTTLFGPPAALNTNAGTDSGNDYAPQLTTDEQGNWVAVWSSEDSLGGTIDIDTDILFSRSTDDGQTWSVAQALNTNATVDAGSDSSPQLTTDGQGNWVAVWESEDPLGGTSGWDSDILFARSTDAGQTWSDPQSLNTNATTDSGIDRSPQLTTDGQGNWVVIWYCRDSLGGATGDKQDILFARSTDAGQTWSDPQLLNTNPATDSGWEMYSQLTTDGQGNWVAVWMSAGTMGSDYDLLFTRSTDAGQTWSTSQPLNTNATTDSGSDYMPDLTTDGQGNWVAVWSSEDSLGGTIGTDQDVLFAHSTDAGQTWSTPQPLNTNAATDSGSDHVPDMTTDGQGNWLVVWTSNGSYGSDNDILFAQSTDAGQTWSSPQPLDANAATTSWYDNFPTLTTDGQGNWVAAWTWDDSLGGSIGEEDTDILFARAFIDVFDFGDAPSPFATLLTDDGARHGVGGPRLGATWDGELDGQPSLAADGDDASGDDEDGVTFGAMRVGQLGAEVIVNVQGAPTGAKLDAWIDFNADGSWNGPIEKIADSIAVTEGDNTITFDVPSSAIAGDTYARFRLSTDGGLTPLGEAPDGEVEDYQVAVTWFGPPAALNTNAQTDSGHDTRPQLTTDGQGHWVAVWSSKDSLDGMIGTDYDILFSRSTDEGQTWSTPLALNTNADTDSGWDDAPRIRIDGSGNCVAIWESKDTLAGTIGTDYDILWARSTDYGETWSSPQPLNTNATLDVEYDVSPDLATDNLGNWVATWRSNNSLGGTIGTDNDILFSRSTNDGQTWSTPQALNSTAGTDSMSDSNCQVTTDGIGNWVAAWRSNESLGGTNGTDGDIFFARSMDQGATWSTSMLLNTNATTDSGGDFSPRLTTDGQGNWIAVWQSSDSLGGTLSSDYDVLFARSIDSAHTWSEPQPLNTNANTDSGGDYHPQLTTDGHGNWIAVWYSYDSLDGTIGEDPDILFARSTDTGQTWSWPQALNTNAVVDGGSNGDPQLATDGLGNWVAVWQSDDSFDNTIGIDNDIIFARAFFASLQIDVGDHLLHPATGGQVVDVFVVGGEEVSGVNFNVQVGDGGTEAGGNLDGPEIDGLRIFDDAGPRGFVFDDVNTGTTDLDGPSPDAVPQWEVRSTTTTSGTVTAAGLLGEITLSTLNSGVGGDFTSGTWDLNLSSTVNGATDFPGTPVTVIDGTITISTKPTAKPVTDAEGQYMVAEGGTLVLDGSESTDPEQSFMFGARLLELDSIAEYRWDLDGDGVFGELGASAANGDELGASPTFSAVNLDGDDDSPWTISLQVVDTTGLVSDVVSTDVLITNLPPSIDTLGISGPINEGGTATLSGTYSDPASGDTHELDIDWNGDGTYDQTVTITGGTFSVDHQYLDDDPTGTSADTFNVQVKLRDDDGGADTGSTSLTVLNVAPTASITGDLAGGPEGTAVDLAATVTDPGVTDTFSYLWQVTASNGQSITDGTNSTFSFTPNDNGSYIVTLSVADDDTGSTTDTATITIVNVTPSIDTLSVIGPIDENQGTTLSGTYTDPGSADTHTLEIDWDGDGTYDQTASVSGGTFSLNHLYLDDDPTNTPSDTLAVGVRLADDDAASVTDAISLTVNNVAPSVTITGIPPSGVEGTAISLGSSVSDPGTLDTFSYLWQVTATNGQVVSDGTSSSFAFTPNDNGSYTVTLTVTDDDTGVGSDSATFTVGNVAPVLGTTSMSGPIDESDTATLAGTYQDVGTADTHQIDVDWNGDGTYDQTVTIAGGTFSVDHQYLDDDPTGTASDTFDIGVRLRDDDSGTDTGTASLTVNNVAPQFIDTQTDRAVHIDNDQPLTLDWTFNDPGSLDTYTATIDWGDGTIEPASVLPGTVQATHTYATIGSYPVSLTLTDDDTGQAVDSFTLDVVQGIVQARHIFYNNSSFDGNTPGAVAADDNAIDPSKQVLLPGETATFANYTSYSRGINGIMIDVTGLGGTPTASDFVFKVGNDNSPAGWATAPAPQSISVRSGAGVNGSDRVTIIWADNDWQTATPDTGAIAKQWLEVTVLATATTGLGQPDVFYIGNAVGDTGNSATDTIVNATDEIGARNNPHWFLDPALVDDAYDFNRDARVDATDQIIARTNQTFFLTDLELISPPVPAPSPAAPSPPAAALAVDELLAEAPLMESVAYQLTSDPQIASAAQARHRFDALRQAAAHWYSHHESQSHDSMRSPFETSATKKASDEVFSKFWF